MKVALNSLPGGIFDLCDKAVIELFKRVTKRDKIYIYLRANNRQYLNISQHNLRFNQFGNITNMEDIRDIWLSEIYLGMITLDSRLDLASAEATQINRFIDSIDRDNKHLIKLVEEWGSDKVSGHYGFIRLEETESDNWAIEDNDGVEKIIYY